MGIFDMFKEKAEELKDKATDLVGGHADQGVDGLNQAGDFVDQNTGGMFGDQIDQGVDQMGQSVDQGVDQMGQGVDQGVDQIDQGVDQAQNRLDGLDGQGNDNGPKPA